jgi:hypothetical protein
MFVQQSRQFIQDGGIVFVIWFLFLIFAVEINTNQKE